jgi:hypothetical protein
VKQFLMSESDTFEQIDRHKSRRRDLLSHYGINKVSDSAGQLKKLEPLDIGNSWSNF